MWFVSLDLGVGIGRPTRTRKSCYQEVEKNLVEVLRVWLMEVPCQAVTEEGSSQNRFVFQIL